MSDAQTTEKLAANPSSYIQGLPQRGVVSLFGMPNQAQGNPDEGNPSGDYLVWEYDNIDLEITFRHTQAAWVVKTWSID